MQLAHSLLTHAHAGIVRKVSVRFDLNGKAPAAGTFLQNVVLLMASATPLIHCSNLAN
jgi:hypothetical protein